MEEKKLTDKEIVKDIERSTGMPSYWKGIVLDLIHRLQDDNKRLTIAEKQYLSEIERLNKSCGLFDIKLQGQIKETYDYVHKAYKLKKHNTELQKQVDGLKLDVENWKKSAYGYKYAEEQAVKDTAKEIIKWIKRNGILEYGGYVIHDSTLEQIGKKYGVEVE